MKVAYENNNVLDIFRRYDLLDLDRIDSEITKSKNFLTEISSGAVAKQYLKEDNSEYLAMVDDIATDKYKDFMEGTMVSGEYAGKHIENALITAYHQTVADYSRLDNNRLANELGITVKKELEPTYEPLTFVFTDHNGNQREFEYKDTLNTPAELMYTLTEMLAEECAQILEEQNPALSDKAVSKFKDEVYYNLMTEEIPAEDIIETHKSGQLTGSLEKEAKTVMRTDKDREE